MGIEIGSVTMKVEMSPGDREAFRANVERICLKYGDHPHTRRQRDIELKQAAAILIDCATFEMKGAR